MYLKQLEIQGFKSFADRTRLTFEPGMIAIVGPNGCGKSNVSDAIRWVLGEQRPSALRCGKMQDLIFNGTDSRKPVGMAEVSLVFSDCEKVLGTDYNEVTITRRVHRTGENLYFLNKVQCRLKDLQRLFMGTGVGTTSYSVMAQGQIDAILSSKPEDRRAVFEEAAGVTKFKADRKEAMRKIEQTEANLTRLEDILREVARQIASLQRQAEKAEQFKRLQAQLQELDLAVNTLRMRAFEEQIAGAAIDLAAEQGKISQYQQANEELAVQIASVEAQMAEAEAQINVLTESLAQARAKQTRADEIIRTNTQRIQEYELWLKRDAAECDELRTQSLASTESPDAEAAIDLEAFEEEALVAEQDMEEAQANFDDHQQTLVGLRDRLAHARDRQLAVEHHLTTCQGQLVDFERRQREALAKHQELLLKQEESAARQVLADETFEQAQEAFDLAQETIELAREELIEVDESRSYRAADLQEKQAAREALLSSRTALLAKIDVLSAPLADQAGAALSRLLDPANPLGVASGDLVGAFADVIGLKADAPAILATVFGPWAGAMVVADADAAKRVLARLTGEAAGLAVDLLVAQTPSTAASHPLESWVRCEEALKPLVRRLLAQDTLLDGMTSLSPDGDIRRHPVMDRQDPLMRQGLVDELESQLAQIEAQITTADGEIARIEAEIDAMTSQWNRAKQALEKAQHTLAQTEAVLTVAKRGAIQAREEALRQADAFAAWQSTSEGALQDRDALQQALVADEAQREEIVKLLAQGNQEQTALEAATAVLSSRLTEARIRCAGINQQRNHLTAQREAQQRRIEDIKRTIAAREASMQTYHQAIAKLQQEIADLTQAQAPMDEENQSIVSAIEAVRAHKQALDQTRQAHFASSKENALCAERSQQTASKLEVALAEARLKRHTLLERLCADYALTEQTLPPPPETLPMPEDECDATIAKLTAQIAALGSVNLLAIQEFEALQERQAFMQGQYDDLMLSKTQILDLIQTINTTSGQRFRDTFNQANANFSAMFSRLFHGGEAKLILLENKEDPLECGIDIIARPPGKKPQTISLLSGGERTMTAVSLLFAIFLIKPAPFCLLDELDAALDDSNIGRFVAALKDFLVHSQFLIITHNQHTIAGSDIVYGITMPEKGISKALSIKLG